MKVLVLAPRTPCEKGKADSFTVYYLIQYLYKKGHQIHLITYTPQTIYEADNLKELDTWCESVNLIPLNDFVSKAKVITRLFNANPLQINYYFYGKFKDKVNQVISDVKPDCVYAHLIRMAEYVKDSKLPKLLAMQIAQTLNYGRLIQHDKNILRRILYGIEYEKIKKYEYHIAQRFDKVLLISKHDKAAIDPDNQLKNVHFCPHGIDVDYYSAQLALSKKPHSLIMNGDFGTPTNIQAATYFIKEIFPLVKEKIPACTLTFAGRDSDHNLQKFSTEDIILTGRVEDMRPYLQAAEIAINPVKIAAGMQNKTLVSMATGLPVVSTSIANEGIQAVNNKEILLADTAAEFADKIIQLFSNPSLYKEIKNGGQQFVHNKWNLEVHHLKLERILTSLIVGDAVLLKKQ